MALTTARAKFAAHVHRTLKVGLSKAGIPAQTIHVVPVKGTRLNRIRIVSRKFRDLGPSERQDIVWRILRQNLRPDEELRISMVLTLTPQDLQRK